MNKSFVVAAALAVATSAGCQKKASDPAGPPPTSTPLSAEQREAFARKAPGAILGTVTHAMPESRLVRVGEVDTAQFQRNETVTFLSGNDQVVTPGWVVEVQADSVHVQYADPGDGQRAPLVGDTAVKFGDDRRATTRPANR